MINYRFVGWCKEQDHDKVWICVQLGGDDWLGTYLTAWGRRGKKLQTKMYKDQSFWNMRKLIDQKQNKGYRSIESHQLDNVYPEFETDLQKTTMWSLLKA